MRRDLRRWIILTSTVILGLLLLALSSLVVQSPHGSPPASSPSPTTAPATESAQAKFQSRMIADVMALDRGILGYQAPAALGTDDDTTLKVQVTDVGKGPNGQAPLPKNSPWIFSPVDVPTGGIVSVQATCVKLICTPEAPERQAILEPGAQGNWIWNVTAKEPGTGRITLATTTYDQDTATPLHNAQPAVINVRVTATGNYRIAKAAGWIKWLFGFIGFGAILTAIQAARRWRRKRREHGTHEKSPVKADEPSGDPN